MRFHPCVRRASTATAWLTSMSSGNAQHDRAGPSGNCCMKCVADELRNPVGAIDLRDPFGHLSEHAPVVHFLKGFALDHVAADLADEQDHRCRILIGGMHANARVGRARTSCDKADARAAGELAVGFRHESRAAFLPAYDQPHAFAHVVKRIQHVEIALSRNAKRECLRREFRSWSTRMRPPLLNGMFSFIHALLSSGGRLYPCGASGPLSRARFCSCPDWI